MFSDLVKAFARCASRVLRRRRNFHLTILLTIAILWFDAFSRLDSDFPYFPRPNNLNVVVRGRYGTEADMDATARCLLAQGIYAVEATEATIIEPFTVGVEERGWLEEVTKRGREREHCSAHHPHFHHMGVWNIQPIFAIPARSEAIDSCTEKDLACYYDIAINYFARRRGTVIKTKKPFRYICRAVLQQSVRQAPADYQEFQQTIRRTVYAPGTHMHTVILTTAVKIASPRRRNILCEALTPEDTVLFDSCGRIRAEPNIPLFPCFSILHKYLTSQLPSRYIAILPLAKGQMFWPNIFLLATLPVVELILLTVLYFALWGLLRQCIILLEICAQEEIDCTTDEALRWLVPASHRLHDHLEFLVEAEIITPQQYCAVVVREKTRGKIYIHSLLRRFIVKNSTMDQLRVYIAKAGIDIDDGWETQTSSESDSDHETAANSLAIMAVCQIFSNLYDSTLENLLELHYITSHQYVRIYDTRIARGSFAAGALLIRIVHRNNKGKEFLRWYCKQFQIADDHVLQIAMAIDPHTFHFPKISLTESIFSRMLSILSCYGLVLVLLLVIPSYICLITTHTHF